MRWLLEVMAKVEVVDVLVVVIQGEAMDAEIRVHVIALIVVGRTTSLTSARTNLENLSGLRLLMLLVQLPPHPLLLPPLYRYFRLTMIGSFSSKLPSHFSLHIVPPVFEDSAESYPTRRASRRLEGPSQ